METMLWLAIASINGTSIAVSAYPTYEECSQYLELNRSGTQCVGVVNATGGTIVLDLPSFHPQCKNKTGFVAKH